MCAGFLLILLALAIQAPAEDSLLWLEPAELRVLRGMSASFNCSTASRWNVMIWHLNDRVVLTISRRHGIMECTQCEVFNHSSPDVSSWEMVLQQVDLKDHTVTCEVQNGPKNSSNLFVEETGSIQISGGNVSVVWGQQVVLQCQTHGWFPSPNLTWLLNGEKRDTLNTSSMLDTTGLYSTTSTFTIRANKSSRVECQASLSALLKPQSSVVSLTVVMEMDTTLVKRLVVYLSSITAVLAVVICTVLCSRKMGRTRKCRHPNAMRIVQGVSANSVATDTEGRINPGYISAYNTGNDNSHLSNSAHGQKHAIASQQIPDVISSNDHTACTFYSADGIKTSRRVTTV
ncbi:SH3 domain-binding glutamic acid-rich protein isoform X2 [Denticeps clupeoides]|uniref:SH3 domain-binding glutamic acid-rich protein isoform X2 n=1 Tax=Denticeps clupeoides TaxID=299321 RepID=UPI0010A55015|nr:immunoglobulin superfamily member 5-like isoform X2 [Denticeps clupeoides]